MGLEVKEEDLEGVVTRGKLCLVGKLLADRVMSKEQIKSSLLRGWKLTGTCTFKLLEENLFVIEFQHAWDKSNVLEGRPWTFEGHLFAIEDFHGLTPPTQMVFDKAAFWVLMYNLPLACMSAAIGSQIGSSVGEVEDVDVVDDGVGWGEFLRVRILLDLSKPLARGWMLKLKNNSVWVAFQYEKLPNFCFWCGLIRHGSEGCLRRGGRRPAGGGEENQFGPWLKAQFPNRSGAGRWRAGNHSSATSQSQGETKAATSSGEGRSNPGGDLCAMDKTGTTATV